jgi:hypothetical protein
MLGDGRARMLMDAKARRAELRNRSQAPRAALVTDSSPEKASPQKPRLLFLDFHGSAVRACEFSNLRHFPTQLLEYVKYH